MGEHPGLISTVLLEEGISPAGATDDQRTDATKTAKERYLTCLLLSGADNTRYGQLKTDLENENLKGKDAYPKNYKQIMKLLNNYKSVVGRAAAFGNNRIVDNPGGVAFLQSTNPNQRYQKKVRPPGAARAVVKAKDTDATKRVNSKGESHCFHCGKADHWADTCPDLSEEQKAQIMVNYELDEEEPEYDENGVQLFNQGNTEDTEVAPIARKTLNKHHVC